MSVLDDVLGPSPSMFGPQGVRGTVNYQSGPKPKKLPQTPVQQGAKPAPPSDPETQLAALRAQSVGSDPEAELAALRGGAPDTAQAFHAEYQRGDLAKRMASENAETQAESPPMSGMEAAASTGASLAKDIPGAEAAQSFVRSLARHQPYREARSDIQTGEERLPASVRIPARVAGGTIAALAIPGSPLVQGAVFGGAGGALQANPDISPGRRAWDTAKGAGIGAILGKAAEYGTAALRGHGVTPIDEAQVALKAGREEASHPLYEQFRKLGDLGPTPKLQAILDLPIVRRAVETVKGESPVLAGLPDTDARVLDAVYKRVGNKAFAALHGFEPGEARTALADAIEEAAQAKGGTYAKALTAFRGPSQEMNAITRGSLALKNAARPTGTATTQMTQTSPAAFRAWLESAPPSLAGRATEGIEGQLQQSPTLARIGTVRFHLPVPYPSRTLQAAPGLLRSADAASGRSRTLEDVLRALGVASGTRP